MKEGGWGVGGGGGEGGGEEGGTGREGADHRRKVFSSGEVKQEGGMECSRLVRAM